MYSAEASYLSRQQSAGTPLLGMVLQASSNCFFSCYHSCFTDRWYPCGSFLVRASFARSRAIGFCCLALHLLPGFRLGTAHFKETLDFPVFNVHCSARDIVYYLCLAPWQQIPGVPSGTPSVGLHSVAVCCCSIALCSQTIGTVYALHQCSLCIRHQLFRTGELGGI